MVVDNNLLGKFHLCGVKEALCGIPKLKAVLEVDMDGKVSAWDEKGEVSNHIVIMKDSWRLCIEEVNNR